VVLGGLVVRSVDETLAGKGYRPDVTGPVRSSRQEREGTLTLDVVDAASNTVVWRGSAETALTGASDPRAREARVQDAVRRILERFPPE
jgi:hypothetical protein